MIKKLFLLCLLLRNLPIYGQIIVSLALPSGIVQKSQLWNMIITNTTTSAQTIHIEMFLKEVASGQSVLKAVSNTFQLAAGVNKIDITEINPIQYQAQNGPYPVDTDPFGMLPIGHFEACFIIHLHEADNVQPVVEQCQEVIVEPISPPILTYPNNGDTIKGNNTQFAWTPPTPVSLFSNLIYRIKLVEVYQGQSSEDAISKNIPLFTQSGITSTSLPYPLSASELLSDKQYAWQIIAASNGSEVSESEVWYFYKVSQNTDVGATLTMPFIKLKKGGEEGFAIFVSDIKFDYFNESADSIWNVKCFDLTSPERKEIEFDLNNIPLIKGQNLVTYKGNLNTNLIDKHLYLLEVYNSRNEVWHLRFEFRKPNE